jgi:hypothetical protein
MWLNKTKKERNVEICKELKVDNVVELIIAQRMSQKYHVDRN